MAHKDIPKRQDIEALASARIPHSVSIYIPTGHRPDSSEKARIELKNLARDAAKQLQDDGASAAVVSHLEDEIEQLIGNAPFWKQQSQSLAIFIDPNNVQTYRLPNRFTSTLDVADRFYIKPLMRTITFPQSAYVLSLAQNSVRLIKVTADEDPEVLDVPGLPENFESYINIDYERQKFDRAEHDNAVYIQKYAAEINKAVYPVVRATKLPLILAAAEPLNGAYRRANSYEYLTDEMISGNPEAFGAGALADKARPILDRLYADEIAQVVDHFKSQEGQLMASRDLRTVAEGAALYAIDSLLIDFDERIPGSLNEMGEITLSDADDASNYGVVDEILRLALVVNARVYAVRSDEMPDGAQVAATFRFPVS